MSITLKICASVRTYTSTTSCCCVFMALSNFEDGRDVRGGVGVGDGSRCECEPLVDYSGKRESQRLTETAGTGPVWSTYMQQKHQRIQRPPVRQLGIHDC